VGEGRGGTTGKALPTLDTEPKEEEESGEWLLKELSFFLA